MEKLKITTRTKVNRLPKRASYEVEEVYKILDQSFVCQIGFKIDGQVNIIPTLYGRKNDLIFIHGSKNSRMLKSFSSGEDICLSVTTIDGIVMARSAFHHSVNYRSVVLFGKPSEIINNKEKTDALEAIFDHFIPGRWDDVRKPNEKELNLTSVFSVKIDEASAKMRSGPPADDKEDYSLKIWAGIIPIKKIYGEPVRDDLLPESLILPDYIKNITK